MRNVNCCGGKEAKELDTTSSTPVCQKPGCRNWLQMFAGYHGAPYAAAWGQIANVLFPAGFTCGGTKPAIDKLCEIATKACHSVCVAGSPEGTAKLCMCCLALVFQRIFCSNHFIFPLISGEVSMIGSSHQWFVRLGHFKPGPSRL